MLFRHSPPGICLGELFTQVNLDKIFQLAQAVASKQGLTVIDVHLGQQGRSRALSVTILKPGGTIGLDDCEQVSRTLEKQLDEQSPPLIDGAFMLEVESPGTERKLKGEREYLLFEGQKVEVKTKEKLNGLGCAFTGYLEGMHDGRLRINQPEIVSDRKIKKRPKANVQEDASTKCVEVELANIIQVRLLGLKSPTETNGAAETGTPN